MLQWFKDQWDNLVGLVVDVAGWFFTQIVTAVVWGIEGIVSVGMSLLDTGWTALASTLTAIFPGSTTFLNGVRNWTTGTGTYEGNAVLGQAGFIGSIFLDMPLITGSLSILAGATLAALAFKFLVWFYHQFWGSN